MAQLWRKRRHHSRPSWYRSRVPLLLEVMADRHSLFDRSTLTATGYGRISALVVTARSVTPSPLKSLVTMTSDSVSAIKFRCHDRGIAHDELVGFDGLVNWRVPPIAQAVPKDVQAAICTLRQANPNIDVAVIVEHVAKYHAYTTSGTVVKRVLKTNGLARRCGPVSGAAACNEQRLELGGMKLSEAALVVAFCLATTGDIRRVKATQ